MLPISGTDEEFLHSAPANIEVDIESCLLAYLRPLRHHPWKHFGLSLSPDIESISSVYYWDIEKSDIYDPPRSFWLEIEDIAMSPAAPRN